MAFATDASLVPELPPPNAKAATAARPTTAAATTAQIQRGNEPRPPPLRVSTRFLGAWTVLGVRGARGVFAFFATRTGYGPNRRIAQRDGACSCDPSASTYVRSASSIVTGASPFSVRQVETFERKALTAPPPASGSRASSTKFGRSCTS